MLSFLKRWGFVIAWISMISIASSISNPFVVVPEKVQTSNESIGRLSHFLEFLILAVLVSRAYAKYPNTAIKVLVVSFFSCLGFAIFDELHQYFVPGRTFQLLDLGLDSVGIILGSAIHYWSRK